MRKTFWAVFGCIILAQTLAATTVVKMELPEIVQKSDCIVEAMAETVESKWDAQRKLAFTYVTLRIDEEFKCGAVKRVQIKLLGGTVGALTVSVPGMPQFSPGERAIVFLRRQPDGSGTYDLVGLNQGVYEIVGEYAVSDLSGVELIDPKTGAVTKPLANQKTPLSDFKRKIREALQASKR